MPDAAQTAALETVLGGVGRGRQPGALEVGQAQRRQSVGAAIEYRVETASDIEDPDRAPGRLDYALGPRGVVGQRPEVVIEPGRHAVKIQVPQIRERVTK